MGIGIRRPLCCFCWIFVLTVALYLGSLDRILGYVVAALALLLGLALLLIAGRTVRRARWLYLSFLCLAILLGSATMLVRAHVTAHSVEVYAKEEQTIHATVLTREYAGSYRSALTVRIDRIGESPCLIKAYVQCDFLSSLQIGDRFEANADVLLLEDAVDLGEVRRSYLADGCRLFVSISEEADCDNIVSGENGGLLLQLRLAAASLQRHLALNVIEEIGGQEGALSAALLLGYREKLDGLTSLDVRRSGASHLLALSGLHLSIIVGVLSWLLLRLRVPFGVRLTLVSVFAMLYLFITGCSMSTLRATVMLLYLLLANKLGRSSDSLTSLSLFFAVCVAIEPYLLYDAALWLSSLAAFVLVGVLPALAEKRKKGESKKVKKKGLFAKIGHSLAASLLITVVIMLPTSLIFGEISLLTPVVTVLLTPLITLLLVLGLPLLLMSGCGNWVVARFWCGWIARAMQQLALWVLRITAHFSDLDGAVLSLRYDFCRWLLPLFAVVFAVLLLVRLKHRFPCMLAPAALLVAFGVLCGVQYANDADVFTAEHVTKGKSELLLLAHDGDVVLCDFSDGSYGVYSTLLSDGVTQRHTELNGVVLTHYHSKHISAMEKLFSTIKVRCLYLPLTMSICEQEKALYDEGVARVLMELAERYRVSVVFYSPGEGVSIGEISLQSMQFEMLERSAHPVVVTVWSCAPQPGDESISLTYLGASFHETDMIAPTVPALLSQSRAVILGEHGPLIKQPIALTGESAQPEYLIVPGKQAAGALLIDEGTGEMLEHTELYVLESDPVLLRMTAEKKE